MPITGQGIHVDTTEVDRFLRKLDVNVPKLTAKALNILASKAKAHARSRHPRREPPKSRYSDRTGNLTKSIQVNSARITSLAATVYSKMQYAPFVEHGTRRAPPYPFMGPAAAATQDAILPLLKVLVDKALRDSAR